MRRSGIGNDWATQAVAVEDRLEQIDCDPVRVMYVLILFSQQGLE